MHPTFNTLKRIIKLMNGLIFGEVDNIKVTSQNRQQYLDYLKSELENSLFHGYELKEGRVNRINDYIEYRLFLYGIDKGLIRLSKYADEITIYFIEPNYEINITFD